MSRISDRVARVEPQQIRVMFELAKELDREDVIHLEFGEADFNTADRVVEAAHTAAMGGETKYTSNAGIRELRETIARRIDERSDYAVDPASEVAVTTGGVEALFLAIASVTDPGDDVVVPTPAWPNIISQPTFCGCRPIEVPLRPRDGYYDDVEAVLDAIDDDTAAVMLVSPSNPTGQAYTPEAVRRIATAAASHGAYLIADEVYRELRYTELPPPVADIAESPEWVLSVDSMSKSHAMTGWRVGWLTGPEDVIGQVVKIRENTTSCVNTPAQYAAIEALRHGGEDTERMRAELSDRRDYVLSALDGCEGLEPLEPLGGFYVFVELGGIDEPSMAFAKRLLREEGVVVAPGSAFGEAGEGHIRLSFGTNRAQLRRGMERMTRFVDG